MNRFSHQERRNRLILRITIGLMLALVIGFFFVDSPLRASILDSLNLAQEKDQRQQIFKIILTSLAVIIIGGSILLDYSEKLHFLLEIIPKLLGYDVESMAEREKDFGEIPETYVRRPWMEQKLLHNLTPDGTSPRLVVLADMSDTGKTTLITFVARRFLNRRYRGRITYCRGDLQSVERELGESDNHARLRLVRRILVRVIKAADVGGDTGDTVKAMSKAIAEHFEREHKPWLIVIDQIDDPDFAYQDLLPSLYGTNNTILVVAQHRRIPEATRRLDDEGHLVPEIVLAMEPLTEDEATQLLSIEVRQRHKRLGRAEIAQIRSRLAGVSPGLIQRLSDYYATTDGKSDIAQILPEVGDAVSRSNTVASIVVHQLPSDQRRFIGALGLLHGDTVEEPFVRRLAEKLGMAAQANEMLRLCTQRRYLEPVPGRHAAGERRFTITKLGQGIAANTLLTLSHDEELTIGAALLDIFRANVVRNESIDVREEVRHVLGMIAWAHEQSHLPDRDLIMFIRTLRQAFYAAGVWTAGITWLEVSEEIAESDRLYRTVGDLASARAQLLMGLGQLTSARACVAKARAAYASSTALAEDDLRHMIFEEDEMHRWMRADMAQRRWLEHLSVLERLWGTSSTAAEFDAIAANINAVASGDGSADAPDRHLPVMLTIDLARAQMGKGDALRAEGNRKGAREMWRTASRTLDLVAAPGRHVTATQAEWLAQIWRLKGTIHRRQANDTSSLGQWWNRRIGNRDFIRALGYTKRLTSHFEEALTLYESALLAIEGAPPLRDPSLAKNEHPPRHSLSVRWGGLQSARRQLMRANGQFATLRAQATQFHTMVALARVSLALAAISHDEQTLTEARGYARGARTISDELKTEHPALMIALAELPEWLVSKNTHASHPVAPGRLHTQDY